MVYTELTGAFAIALGVFALARPMSIRSFSKPKQWEGNPETAKQEQRAYAAMFGFAAILGGAILIGLGLTGTGS